MNMYLVRFFETFSQFCLQLFLNEVKLDGKLWMRNYNIL